jgi:hypothetical protein
MIDRWKRGKFIDSGWPRAAGGYEKPADKFDHEIKGLMA